MKRFAVIFALVTVCLTFAGCGENARTKRSAEEYSGISCEAAAAELEKAGFTDIVTNEVVDLTSDSSLDDGDVGEISIGGVTDFEAGASFAKTSPVIITYHTIRKIDLPLSDGDALEMDYADAGKAFQDAGFTNVSVSEEYDLDPDTMTEEYLDKILVSGASSFAKGEQVPFDAKITVIRHFPYEKYNAEIFVSVTKNTLFSKYDVDVYLDGTELGTVSHGGSDRFSVRLREGSHSVVFTKAGSDKNDNKVILDITGDTEVSYTLSCNSDEIAAETGSMSVTEFCRTPLSTEECPEKDYAEIEKSFRDAGFENVTAEPAYDITDKNEYKENSVKSVSIGTSDRFEKGEKFKKNLNVIITYHLKEEDDPVKIAEREDATKRNVTVHVVFVPNLIFSTYDLDVYLDGEKIDTLPHGTDKDYQFRLKMGKYTLTFSSADPDNQAKGELTLDVTDDVETKCRIYCYSGSVGVTVEYTEYKNAAGENEIMVPYPASEYTGDNYKTAADKLKALGFTNVKTEPVYDIIFGITDENTTASVSIDGNKNFTRGTVFPKDAEVIVTYHLNYDDSPERIAEEEEREREREYEFTYEEDPDIMAYALKFREYSIYYYFDMKSGTVKYFTTNDSLVLNGRFTGSFEKGITIYFEYGDESWTEKFKLTIPGNYSKAMLTDNDGYGSRFERVDPAEAKKVLDQKSREDESDTTAETNAPTTRKTVVTTTQSSATKGEQNALITAKAYLAVMPFSYNGLVEQLEFEGYSHSEAVYGADNCGADWNKQAKKMAKDYLDIMPFSKDELIEQLEYEGFTHSQAVYGAEANGY